MAGGCENWIECNVWVRSLDMPVSWAEIFAKTKMTYGVKKRL
jgi:hypothetical protein